MRDLEWPPLDRFDRRFFRTERLRWSIRYTRVAQVARIPSEHVRRWEEGKFGSVNDDWRAKVYAALRSLVIEQAKELIRLLMRDSSGTVIGTSGQSLSQSISGPGFLAPRASQEATS